MLYHLRPALSELCGHLNVSLNGVITGFTVTPANGDERTALWEISQGCLEKSHIAYACFFSSSILEMRQFNDSRTKCATIKNPIKRKSRDRPAVCCIVFRRRIRFIWGM
jgi:hypothetical protein